MSLFSVTIIFLDQWYPGNYKITTKFSFVLLGFVLFVVVFFCYFVFGGGGGGCMEPATSPWTIYERLYLLLFFSICFSEVPSN